MRRLSLHQRARFANFYRAFPAGASPRPVDQSHFLAQFYGPLFMEVPKLAADMSPAKARKQGFGCGEGQFAVRNGGVRARCLLNALCS